MHLTALLLAALLVGSPKGKAQPCTLTISIVERDSLGNVSNGLSTEALKWFNDRVNKKFPNVCYAEQKADEGTWFYIDISTVTGASTSGHLDDKNVQLQTVPTIYPIYTMKIGRFQDGNLRVLKTLQRSGVPTHPAGTLMGFFQNFGNPEKEVIMDGVTWLAGFAKESPQ